MTDELVNRLRGVDHMCVEDCFMQSPLFAHAADRIETLEAQLDITLKDRALILAERDKTFDRILKRVEDAEVKAVAAEKQSCEWGSLLADVFGATLDWNDVLKGFADYEATTMIDRMRALLTEAASDLECYISADYPADTRAVYPDIQRRYDRDMEFVRRIRAELKWIGE